MRDIQATRPITVGSRTLAADERASVDDATAARVVAAGHARYVFDVQVAPAAAGEVEEATAPRRNVGRATAPR